MRRLQPLGHASKRKGRESNPQGREAHPFSRRGTAPMAALPNASGPGRSRTCTTPIKSRRLFQLSYEARTKRDRQGSNLRRLAFQASALPLSYGHEK